MVSRDHTLKTKYVVQIRDALPSTIEDIEKAKILESLKKAGWVKAKDARMLGIMSRQIVYKMNKYNIQEVRSSLFIVFLLLL